MYRGGGSIAVTGRAHVGLLAAKDPDDGCRRLPAVVKNNRGAKAAMLRFQLVPEAVQIASEWDVLRRIGWRGRSSYTAGQPAAPPAAEEQKEEKEEAKTSPEKAKELPRGALAEKPRPVKGAGPRRTRSARRKRTAPALSTRRRWVREDRQEPDYHLAAVRQRVRATLDDGRCPYCGDALTVHNFVSVRPSS